MSGRIVTVGKPKLLVSACLLGSPVRYDGRAKILRDELLTQWGADGRIIPLCPEMLAGLPTPRPPAEISGGEGSDFILGAAKVIESDGGDASSVYLAGAQSALAIALSENCHFALLTDGSPSCGSTFIRDGSFSGQRRSGAGVVTALLRQHGIAVFAPHEIAELATAMIAAHAGAVSGAR